MNKLKKCRRALNVDMYGDCSLFQLFWQILCCAKLAGASSVSIIPKNQSFSVICKKGKVRREIVVNASWHAVQPMITHCKILSNMKPTKDISQIGEFLPPETYGLPVCCAVIKPTKYGELLRVTFLR